MSVFVNDAGTLREVTEAYVNDAGTLRQLSSIDVNDNGTLRSVPLMVEGTLVAGDWYSFMFGYHSAWNVGTFTTTNNRKLVDVAEFNSFDHAATFSNASMTIELSWSADPTSGSRPYPIEYFEIEGDFGSGDETITVPVSANHTYTQPITYSGKDFVSNNTYKVRAYLR